MFLGIGLETGKTELIHAVLEGVFYHLRWMLECQNKRVKTSKSIRFVGGGALSDVTCQMLADIIGRPVETVEYPQNVGSVGACAISAVGLGLIPSIDSIKDFVKVSKEFMPDKEKHEAYKNYYKTFKKIYAANKGLFAQLAKARK
jgi:xylulokinase